MKFEINQQNSEKIREISKNHGLDLVVIFGSQVSGKINEESDIDIGVYRKSGLTLDDQIVLNKDFSKSLGTDKIDIVIISSHSPVLMYSILKNGKLLYTSENDLFYRMKIYSWKLMAESKKFRDRSFEILKNRISLL